MHTATQTRTLEIDGMSGDACVKKVTSALKDVNGVETHSVKVGSANIKSDKAGCDAACAGIKSAGYTAHEGTRTGNDRNEASGDSKGGQHGSQHGNEQGKGQSQHPVSQPGNSTDADKAGKPASQEPSKVQTPANAPKPVMK